MKKNRVVVGLSGGVDSSVAALILKEQGYEVIGAYIIGWLGEENFPCDWQKEEADAREVAEKIGIPFYSINLSKEYKEKVIDDFFYQYQIGRTPNPDILCNSEIKFRALPEALRQLEVDYFATGHYAKMSERNGLKMIAKPLDLNKDQTYFLWKISKDILPKILFPLGDLTKQAVREKASEFELSTASKRDSQGICFVGPVKVRQFLSDRFREEPGDVILKDGRKIARHEGVVFYTLGQRLKAGSVSWTGDVPPLFVIEKDLKNNILVVGSDSQCYSQQFIAKNTNWHTVVDKEFTAQLRIRHRQPLGKAVIKVNRESLLVKLDQPMRSVTPGQSVVFYQNEFLLGGAVVDELI